MLDSHFNPVRWCKMTLDASGLHRGQCHLAGHWDRCLLASPSERSPGGLRRLRHNYSGGDITQLRSRRGHGLAYARACWWFRPPQKMMPRRPPDVTFRGSSWVSSAHALFQWRNISPSFWVSPTHSWVSPTHSSLLLAGNAVGYRLWCRCGLVPGGFLRF